MLTSNTLCRCWSSQSAPTPRGGRLEKIGNAVVGLRRRFRHTLSFSSPCGFTRDASAHVPAAVRRHLAPGAAGKLVDSICGLCFRLGRVGGTPLAVGFDAVSHKFYIRTPVQ